MSDQPAVDQRRHRIPRRQPRSDGEAQRRARAHVDHCPTYAHPDDYLADTAVVFERGDVEGC